MYRENKGRKGRQESRRGLQKWLPVAAEGPYSPTSTVACVSAASPVDIEFLVAMQGQGCIMKTLWAKAAEQHLLIC